MRMQPIICALHTLVTSITQLSSQWTSEFLFTSEPVLWPRILFIAQSLVLTPSSGGLRSCDGVFFSWEPVSSDDRFWHGAESQLVNLLKRAFKVTWNGIFPTCITEASLWSCIWPCQPLVLPVTAYCVRIERWKRTMQTASIGWEHSFHEILPSEFFA